MRYKLYDSEASAVNAGCCKEQLTEKGGVWYCDVDCKPKKKKEAKAKIETKEDKQAYDTKDI